MVYNNLTDGKHRFRTGNIQINREDGEVTSYLRWPRDAESDDSLSVGMIDSREVEPIRIRFDHSRDGWVIERPDGKEAAFVPNIYSYE